MTQNKTRFIGVLSLIVLLVLSINLFIKAEDQPVNLLANPGFEADADPTKSPKGWSVWAQDNDFSSVITVKGDAHGGDWYCMETNTSSFGVYVYQTLYVKNGKYTLRAWVKYGGGMRWCLVEAKDIGGDKQSIMVPQADAWTQVEKTDIKVTNGKATIGFYAESKGGKSFCFDDVEFFKQP